MFKKAAVALARLTRKLTIVFKKVLNDLVDLGLSARLGLRELEKRQTKFPVSQTENELSVRRCEMRNREIALAGLTRKLTIVFKKVLNDLVDSGLSNRLGLRRFGERQTGIRFPVSQTEASHSQIFCN